MTNSLEKEMCWNTSIQDIHPLLAPGEDHVAQEDLMSRGSPGAGVPGAGGNPALTADCSASLRWVSPVMHFASCSSFPIAILDTQEEAVFILSAQSSLLVQLSQF